jgi:hypothetical protein
VSRTVYTTGTDRPSTSQDANKTREREVNSLYPTMDLPNGCMDWDKILGKGEASLGYAVLKNLEPKTN